MNVGMSDGGEMSCLKFTNEFLANLDHGVFVMGVLIFSGFVFMDVPVAKKPL